MTSSYFATSTAENKYPPEFLASKNPRYVKVIQCKAKYNGYLVGDIMVHASFIEFDHFLDHFCVFTNENRLEPKVYRITTVNPSFRIWFTTIDGKKIEPEDMPFVLELEFIY